METPYFLLQIDLKELVLLCILLLPSSLSIAFSLISFTTLSCFKDRHVPSAGPCERLGEPCWSCFSADSKLRSCCRVSQIDQYF